MDVLAFYRKHVHLYLLCNNNVKHIYFFVNIATVGKHTLSLLAIAQNVEYSLLCNQPIIQ